MAQGKPKITTGTLIVAAVVLIVGGLAIAKMASKPADDGAAQGDNGGTSASGDKVALAQCLTDKGVKMFGASWCPHCAQQKKDFGTAAFKKVTYVECAVPGDNSQQTQICKDNNIKGYPTWRFADGSEKTGEQTLEDLASAAGCTYGDVKAPGDAIAPSPTGAMPINGAKAPSDTNEPVTVPNNK